MDNYPHQARLPTSYDLKYKSSDCDQPTNNRSHSRDLFPHGGLSLPSSRNALSRDGLSSQLSRDSLSLEVSRSQLSMDFLSSDVSSASLSRDSLSRGVSSLPLSRNLLSHEVSNTQLSRDLLSRGVSSSSLSRDSLSLEGSSSQLSRERKMMRNDLTTLSLREKYMRLMREEGFTCKSSNENSSSRDKHVQNSIYSPHELEQESDLSDVYPGNSFRKGEFERIHGEHLGSSSLLDNERRYKLNNDKRSSSRNERNYRKQNSDYFPEDEDEFLYSEPTRSPRMPFSKPTSADEYYDNLSLKRDNRPLTNTGHENYDPLSFHGCDNFQVDSSDDMSDLNTKNKYPSSNLSLHDNRPMTKTSRNKFDPLFFHGNDNFQMKKPQTTSSIDMSCSNTQNTTAELSQLRSFPDTKTNPTVLPDASDNEKAYYGKASSSVNSSLLDQPDYETLRIIATSEAMGKKRNLPFSIFEQSETLSNPEQTTYGFAVFNGVKTDTKETNLVSNNCASDPCNISETKVLDSVVKSSKVNVQEGIKELPGRLSSIPLIPSPENSNSSCPIPFLGDSTNELLDANKDIKQSSSLSNSTSNAGDNKVKSTLEDALDALMITEPIVGLNFIVEYKNIVSINGGFPFKCNLCHTSIARANVIDHVQSFKHRLKYLKLKDEVKYCVAIKQTDKANREAFVCEAVQLLEKLDGRGHVNVQLSLCAKDRKVGQGIPATTYKKQTSDDFVSYRSPIHSPELICDSIGNQFSKNTTEEEASQRFLESDTSITTPEKYDLVGEVKESHLSDERVAQSEPLPEIQEDPTSSVIQKHFDEPTGSLKRSSSPSPEKVPKIAKVECESEGKDTETKSLADILDQLSTSVITSEEEAEAVLKVTDSLVKMLLQYKLKHIDDAMLKSLVTKLHSESSDGIDKLIKLIDGNDTENGLEPLELSTPVGDETITPSDEKVEILLSTEKAEDASNDTCDMKVESSVINPENHAGFTSQSEPAWPSFSQRWTTAGTNSIAQMGQTGAMWDHSLSQQQYLMMMQYQQQQYQQNPYGFSAAHLYSGAMPSALGQPTLRQNHQLQMSSIEGMSNVSVPLSSAQKAPCPPSSLQMPPLPPSSLQKPPLPPSSIQKPPLPPNSIQKPPLPPSSIQKPPLPPSSAQNPPLPPSSAQNPPLPPSSAQNPPLPPNYLQKPPLPPSSLQKPPLPPSSIQKPPLPPSYLQTPPLPPNTSSIKPMSLGAISLPSAPPRTLQNSSLSFQNVLPSSMTQPFPTTFLSNPPLPLHNAMFPPPPPPPPQ